ncbi:hypothetical protein ACQV5M_08475 [Leptospira sp. SA-E8]|uniref:hypothetical protein n=1 Tax=Leptospira sp. SA-E8 TaxID=3422259 RepID=UPI003EC0C64F
MSSLNEKIRQFENSPESFDELVSQFLLTEEESKASELHDLILGSEFLRTRFEYLSKTNKAVREFYSTENRQNGSWNIKNLLYSVAAVVLFSFSVYLYSNFFSSLPGLNANRSISFGNCEEKLGPDSNKIQSGPNSLCEFFFNENGKGKKFKLRIFPNSSVLISRNSESWEIGFEKGKILIDSFSEPFVFGRFPEEVHLNVYGNRIQFLGTKISVFSSEKDHVNIEVLEGKLGYVSDPVSKKKSSEVFLSEGETARIYPKIPAEIRKLNDSEFKNLEESFANIRVDFSQNPDAKLNPVKIIHPEAIEVPGNRIILKNGSVKKGTSLLQKGDIYILIEGDKIHEFKASDIKRIEFE